MLFESHTHHGQHKPTSNKAVAADGGLPIVSLLKFLAPDLVQVVLLLNDLLLRPPDETSSAAERQRASRAIYKNGRQLVTHHSPDAIDVSRAAFSEMFQSAVQIYVLLGLRDLPLQAPKISRWESDLAEKIIRSGVSGTMIGVNGLPGSSYCGHTRCFWQQDQYPGATILGILPSS